MEKIFSPRCYMDYVFRLNVLGILLVWFLNCIANVFLKMYHMTDEIMAGEEPIRKFLA